MPREQREQQADGYRHLWPFHGHPRPGTPDRAMVSHERGLWALKVSVLGLLGTAGFQVAIVYLSGSVGLLADTVHNFSDALTAIPLAVAFALARRPRSRRFTYGLGRAEDVAGLIIVAMIALSAFIVAWESYQKLVHPQPLRHLGWVMAAGLVGFLGNEAVATLRIRVGREIGSAALIADGQHARVDGLTSLAVLVGALGVVAGFPMADPLVGLLITGAILLIVRDAAVSIWQRLMDAVDPELVEAVERISRSVSGVQDCHEIGLRWVGHRLYAELHVTVDEDLPTRESHRLAEDVRHALFHALPHLTSVTVHVDPCGHGGADPHAVTAHHREPQTGVQSS